MNRWFRTWRAWSFSALLMVLALTAIQPQWGASAADCGPNDICYAELFHDSRDLLYRTPGGPAPINTAVTIRFRTASDDVGGVDLRVYNTKQNANNFFPMSKVATDGTYDFWEYTLNTGGAANILYYWFRISDGSALAYYEDDNAGGDFNHRYWGGTGVAVPTSTDASWALTVYDPAYTTPDWVKNGIFYQIFPDRFRNGNSANDPAAGEFFYNEAGGTIVRSLTTNWNTAICDPRADSNNGCEGSWSRNFYGGDLQGITDQLDYLQGIGVNVIYMTPIFEAPSNHKYDARDFSIVDDNFGGDAALTSLVTAAHARGMYVVLDGVFNHVSSDSPYFDRYNRYSIDGACESTTSPYIDLFKPLYPHVPTAQEPTAPCSDGRDYTGWFGFDSLPEFDSQTPGGFARQAIWDGGIVHPADYTGAPTDPVKEIGTYWITNFDIDGWRLDVANDVDPTGSLGTNDYWENFRDKVKAANPDAYIVGEFWGIGTPWISGGTAGSYTPSGSNPGEWDATMNYQQTAMLMGFWRDSALETENDFNPGSLPGKLVPHSPSMLATRYYDLKERYAPEAFYAQMNLNGSHDTQRALWLLDETIPASPTTGMMHPSAVNYYEPGQPGAEAVQNLMGFSLMQYTLPGAPQIYYGTEVGLVNPVYFHNGKWEDDPYNRAPFPWGDETGTPYYTHMTDGNSVRSSLLSYFTTLGATRNAHPSLRTGEVTFSLVDDAADHLGYYRHMTDGSDAAIVLINRSGAAGSMTISLGYDIPVGAVFVDPFTSTTYTTVAGVSGTALTVPSVAANTGMVLVLDSGAYSVPGVPTLSGVAAGGTAVDLSWTLPSSGYTYNVYRSALSGGGGRTLIHSSAVDATSYTDATVSSGVTYYYTVEAVSAGGVASAPSNEVGVTPFYDLTSSYRNVQFPTSITHTLSAVNPTPIVYGQIYVGGVTDAQATPVDGLSAQLGYGAVGTDPSTHPSWTWTNASPNAGAAGGNNDEFQATMLPASAGSFSYTYRYSSDGGATWFYAFDSGDNTCDEATVSGVALCPMTVNVSTDTTPPTAPTLTKDYDFASRVGLSWTESTDDDSVFGYRVYRSDDAGSTFDLVTTVGAAVLSYEDTSVTTNTAYQYYVTAYDPSFNESTESNIVDADTTASPVDVTFNVTVPAFSRVDSAVQIIGNSPVLTTWGAGVNMTPTASPNVWTVTLTFNEGDSFVYKFRRDASWDKVEKGADGNAETEQPYVVGSAEGGPYTVNHTVLNWRDVLVTGTNIANNAVDVELDTAFTATFNKDINQSATFTVVDSGTNAVTGTFSYTANSITFTPTSGWTANETYTVTIGNVPAAGDGGRFFSDTVTFTTADAPVVDTNLLTNGGFEDGLNSWTQVNPTADRVACPTPPTKVYEGACAYRFKGSAGEFSRVQQAVTDFSGLTLDIGDEFVASGWFRTTPNTRLRLRMIVFFSDGTSVARGININGAGAYREVAAPGYVLDRTDVTLVRVRLINRSTIGQTWVDNLNLSLIDNSAPRGIALEAPLSMPDPVDSGS